MGAKPFCFFLAFSTPFLFVQTTNAQGCPGNLLTSLIRGNEVVEYNVITGQQVGVLAQLERPGLLAIDRNQHVYVIRLGSDLDPDPIIVEYNRNGQVIKTFGQDVLVSPGGIAVGRRGHVFVSAGWWEGLMQREGVLEFDNEGKLVGPVFTVGNDSIGVTGLVFGPNGNLFVLANIWTDVQIPIVEYDFDTGAWTPVDPNSVLPWGLWIGIGFNSRDNLLVSNTDTNGVYEFDPWTHTLVAEHTPVCPPGYFRHDMTVAPDDDFYVSCNCYMEGFFIIGYDGTTGEPNGVMLDDQFGPGVGNVVATNMAFMPYPLGDYDRDDDVDLGDFAGFESCFTGPGASGLLPHDCRCMDFNEDNDVDLQDFIAFQTAYTGPGT